MPQLIRRRDPISRKRRGAFITATSRSARSPSTPAIRPPNPAGSGATVSIRAAIHQNTQGASPRHLTRRAARSRSRGCFYGAAGASPRQVADRPPNGLTPASVRTAKPKPKPTPGPGRQLGRYNSRARRDMVGHHGCNGFRKESVYHGAFAVKYPPREAGIISPSDLRLPLSSTSHRLRKSPVPTP